MACPPFRSQFEAAWGFGVEAGTQGPHKIQRGYLPRRTWSAHWLRDENFREAVEDFCRRERAAIEHDMAYIEEISPFRRSED